MPPLPQVPMTVFADILRRIADDIDHNADAKPKLVSVYSDRSDDETEAVVVYRGHANRDWLIEQLRRDS